MTLCWTRFRACVIWPLRALLCRKTGDLMLSFHRTRVKGERMEYNNYRGIRLISVVGKVYTGILVIRVRKVTKGLIDDDQGGFRAGSGCVDQIFTLKQIGEKARE